MSVVLKMCWSWSCPDCGFQNFHLGHDAKPEDMSDIANETGIPLTELRPDDWTAAPDFVFCRKCEARHDVTEEVDTSSG